MKKELLSGPASSSPRGSEPTGKIILSVLLAMLLSLAMRSVSAGEDFYIIHSADVRGYVDPCG